MDSFFLGRTDLTDAIGRSLNVVGYRSRLEPSNDFLEEIHGGGSNKRAFCAIRPFPFLGFDDKDTDQAQARPFPKTESQRLNLEMRQGGTNNAT